MKYVLGIDPGKEGYFVLLKGGDRIHGLWPMPLKPGAKAEEVDFFGIQRILEEVRGLCAGGSSWIYLERAMALAMGSSHAFNYGRGFAAIEIAIQIAQMPVVYVLPQKWMKVMHDGVSADLKPKVRSIVAVERLFPKLIVDLPKNTKGKLKDGPVDALLIAGFGAKELGIQPP